MKTAKITKQRLRELVMEELQMASMENEPLNEGLDSSRIYDLYLGVKNGSIAWPQFVKEITSLTNSPQQQQSDTHFDAHAFANSREEE